MKSEINGVDRNYCRGMLHDRIGLILQKELSFFHKYRSMRISPYLPRALFTGIHQRQIDIRLIQAMIISAFSISKSSNTTGFSRHSFTVR